MSKLFAAFNAIKYVVRKSRHCNLLYRDDVVGLLAARALKIIICVYVISYHDDDVFMLSTYSYT